MDGTSGDAGGAPDAFDGEFTDPELPETNDYFVRDRQFGRYEADAEQDEDEGLHRQLAQFAFVREEDDREVRLSFRDVPADAIAKSFRNSGAILISMTGERALSSGAVAVRSAPGWPESVNVTEEGQPLKGRRRRRRNPNVQAGGEAPASSRPKRHTGELTMRYFYSLRDTVYTVNIASPTGIIDSIANIYPAATQSERELQTRLAVLFRMTGG